MAISKADRSAHALVGTQKQALGALLDKEQVLGFLFVAPALLLLLIFVGYPFFYGIWLSLTNTRIGVPGEFVGLKNFIDLFNDQIFLHTMWNAFEYTGVTTVFKFTLGMAVAVLLNRKIRFQRFIRASILLPWIVPTVLSTIAWLWMYDATFSVFNWMLRQVGLKGPIWLGDGHWPMISLMIVNIWRGMPFYAISFLAGMQTISLELYEAAQIDGANAWKQFRHVTLPLLRPVILVVLLLSIILTFADFQIVWILTRGGPANATHLFATLAYQVGLMSAQISTGAAISLFLFPALCIVIFFTIWILRRED